MEKIKTIRLYRYNIGIRRYNKWMHWEWREIFISCYAGNVF